MSESIGHWRITVRVRFPRIALLFACVVLLALSLAAQSSNGAVNGRVLDPSNRVISGADILIINEATGVKYSGKTNDDGIYVVPNLPPGSYRLQVSKVGFKTLIKPDIVLNIQDALSINFTLPVGAVFDAVTVEGGASMINTTDASVSTVVDQTYVKNMPLNGRSFQDLILLTPGIVTQSPQQGTTSSLGVRGEFNVNGQRQESNYSTVDGVSANVGAGSGSAWTFNAGITGSLASSTVLGTTQALVSVDDLQEFRVQTSTYSAEYGRNPGGQFAFQTKSGTNEWHGTAYDYLRNGVFDAPDWFTDYFGARQPALRQNDFGGTIGGPVHIPRVYNGADKTFFFASYEGLRLTAPQAAVASPVPDLCMRGIIANCPAGRTPAAAALSPIMRAFPAPSPNGLEDAANGIGQFIGSWSNPSSLNSSSVRLDHTLNDKLRLFLRFSETSSSSTTRRAIATNSPSMVNTLTDDLKTYTAGFNSMISNHSDNEFRLNYSSNSAAQNVGISPFGGSDPTNLFQLIGAASNSTEPNVYFLYGGYVFLLAEGQNKGAQSQWNVINTVSLSFGRHQFKFGVDFRRLAPTGIEPYDIPQYYFFSESSVELNAPFFGSTVIAPAYPLYKNFSTFAQDEWKLSQRLNLSLGVRWDVNPAPGVTQGLKPYAIQGSSPATWALAPQGTPLWQTTWFNFAPRLGAAYILNNRPSQEAVIRGGGGVFFDTGQQLGSIAYSGVGFSAFDFNFATPLPFPQSRPVPLIVNPPLGPPFSQIYASAPRLQLPYTIQWNASVEQEFGKSQTLTLSYVGSHAKRLLKLSQFSIPLASTFQIAQNGLTSDYGSFQLQYRRRLSRGLTALASYALAHCIDYGSENYSLGYQRGDCDFDVRHNLSGAFSYDLPKVLGRGGFANAALDHWGFDSRFIARTAFPVTLVGNQLVQPNGQIYDGGLNLVTGQPIYLYGANCAEILQGIGDLNSGHRCPGGRAINPNAFVAAFSGLGDAPRNFTRGFGAWQINLAVRREFPIYERLKLQFRAEAFNVFNHPNFGTINSSFGQNTFGQSTSTLANSLGVLNPLYQMGGSRSMQFALKLLF